VGRRSTHGGALSASEALAVAVGVAALAGVAWLPLRATRVVGALFGGLLAFGVLRAGYGVFPGVALGVVFALVLFRFGTGAVLRRVTFLLPSLLLLVFVTTLLMYHAPGSPFAGEKAASPQVEAALRAHFGIPKSAVEFFEIYLRRLVVEGSLGPSVKVQGRTVEALLGPALPVSVTLGLLALILASASGLVLGIRAGLKPNSWADYASIGLSSIGLALPSFVIGAILIVVFSLELGWLPVAGWGGLRHVVLPAVTLALPYSAYIARLARGGTIEVMSQDFIRTARAKGLSESAVVLRHALKGALLPVVSFLGPAAAGIMTGSFVVETLFGIPGMGQWFVRGAINRDYSVVLGTSLVYASMVTTFNLAVDLAYAWLDPRVRTGAS
jgi:oligopeptide transport system permease protein